jgi:hypothetical protein
MAWEASVGGESWLKMRVGLHKDPHVIAMAWHLHAEPAFLAEFGCVCRDCRTTVVGDGRTTVVPLISPKATLRTTVEGLRLVWGLAREQGRRDGDDLILDHIDIPGLDVMSETPGIGGAMAKVGWAAQGERCVILPRFFEENHTTGPRDAKRDYDRAYRARKRAEAKAAAEQQRQSYDRRTTVANDSRVVVDRGEESRGEDSNPPSPQGGEKAVGQTLAEIRRVHACDRPDLHPLATEIARHYQRAVNPTHALRKHAADPLVHLLASGVPAEKLRAAADGYARQCDDGNLERTKRLAAHNFYSPDRGAYEGFLDYAKPAPKRGAPTVPTKRNEDTEP